MAKVIDISSAPAQKTMKNATIGIHVEETVFIEFPGTGKKENFVKDHVDLGKLCQMMCFPACCLYVPWAGAENRMEYYRMNQCGKCPMAVSLNGKDVGKAHDVGMCDNGAFFCLCPYCTCDSYIKLMGMDGHDGTEKFTFLKSLFPCWPCVQACAMGCAPLGVAYMSMEGCCKYCGGQEFQRITQPVYAGPWSRANGGEPEELGKFVMTYRFNPVSLCCAAPTPLKFYFKPTTPAGENLIKEDLTVLSLVLQMYRGMPAPCKMCSNLDFQMPTGVCCLDIGLGTTVEWKSVQDIMKDSD